ncbi:MAG TPA: flagellar hook-associated protein FlgK [Opitutaceae bacterium]|nr:flagellar hook-associated protein FlgK [Opitutaceae bacterium]
MSGLFSTLDGSVRSLQAQSRALDVTGRNIANVNNANYARESVIFGTVGAQSSGVEALGITQARSSLLDQQVLREVSASNGLQTQQAALQRAEVSLDQNINRSASSSSITQTDNTVGGVSGAMTDFFNSFQALAAQPTDVGQRQTLIQKASILTDRLNQTDQRLANVQADIGTQITTDASQANTILQTIANLNAQIGSAEIGSPGSAVDLRDQRQGQLESLAKIMNFDVQNASNGSGQIQVIAKDTSGGNVVLVNQTTVNGTVAFTGSTITAGSPATALKLTSGSMQGGLNASTGAVATIRTQLNALASQLVTAVNAAYNPTNLTGNFFTSTGTTAGTISVDPTVTTTSLKASDGGQASDNTIAVAVAKVATKTFSTSSGDAINGTLTNFYSGAVTSLGQTISTVNTNVTDQTTVEKLVRNQRDSVSGVSLDEEMANMLKYQRSFEASSRVFNMTDQLLDTVVNKLGL